MLHVMPPREITRYKYIEMLWGYGDGYWLNPYILGTMEIDEFKRRFPHYQRMLVTYDPIAKTTICPCCGDPYVRLGQHIAASHPTVRTRCEDLLAEYSLTGVSFKRRRYFRLLGVQDTMSELGPEMGLDEEIIDELVRLVKVFGELIMGLYPDASGTMRQSLILILPRQRHIQAMLRMLKRSYMHTGYDDAYKCVQFALAKNMLYAKHGSKDRRLQLHPAPKEIIMEESWTPLELKREKFHRNMVRFRQRRYDSETKKRRLDRHGRDLEGGRTHVPGRPPMDRK